MSTYCWWWKGVHPHVYIVDCGKGCTLSTTPGGGGGNVSYILIKDKDLLYSKLTLEEQIFLSR